MKTLNKMLVVVFTLIMSVNLVFANEGKYKLSVTNVVYTSENSLEFDIYLLNTSPGKEVLKYSAGQYFLEFNSKISNGGTLKYSMVGSELPEAFQPRNANIFENQLRLAGNQFNHDIELLPEIISKSPGLLVAKMRLETSAQKFAEEPLNLKWTDEISKFKTKLFVYDGNLNKEITNYENHLQDGVADGIAGNGNELQSLPEEYSLSQNFPNPFNPETKINYELPAKSFVTLKIYDISGREVMSLINQQQEAGRYSAVFNGSNFASGMYFYKITAGEFSAVKKMALIK